MFYAERLGGPGEPYIAERGVFLSIEDFAPYREKGWDGTPETNAAADAYLMTCEASPTKKHVRRLAEEACLYCNRHVSLTTPTCITGASLRHD